MDLVDRMRDGDQPVGEPGRGREVADDGPTKGLDEAAGVVQHSVKGGDGHVGSVFPCDQKGKEANDQRRETEGGDGVDEEVEEEGGEHGRREQDGEHIRQGGW